MAGTIDSLEATVAGLQYEVHMRDIRIEEQERRIAELDQQVHELKKQARGDAAKEPDVPGFVRPNVPKRPRKKPGRKAGHEPAFRAVPEIDRHQEVPLCTDGSKRPLCPDCRTPLVRRRKHRRVVEDLVPGAVEATCYHTHGGYCPRCRRQIESRAPEQPPAANIARVQLGLNALATGAILRVRHRLAFRQIAQLLKDMPGLSISAGGLVKQLKRLARWLDGKYRELIRQMRASPHVHVDETGWRIDGRNFWLWAFTDPTFTLYHIDESRGGKVPLEILGKAFDGTVIADFYSAYNQLNGPKQRCLVHLIREVKEVAKQDAEFADCPLSRRLLNWCKDALRLKKRWQELADAQYEMKASRLEDRLDCLMRSEPTHPEAKRLVKRLCRHRPELTRFLWDKDLDGTNNAAERALRPAVVMRKITGGSRSDAGAQAWATLASLVRSTDQRGLGVFEATKKLIVEYWATGAR
jgi:transposase-like protein